MEEEPAESADVLQTSPLAMKEKLKLWMSNVTVEPMLTLYLMSTIAPTLAAQNLNLDKACRVNLGYADSVCDALAARQTANLTAEETAVQTLVAEMGTWRALIIGGLPVLLLPLFGAWSDRRRRRKPCMLIPLAGEISISLGLLLCVYFTWSPMEVAGFIQVFCPAITGAWFTIYMASYSYIGEVSSEETRTVRMGILNMCLSVGDTIANSVSGILVAACGFYGVFSVTGTIAIAALLYCIFFVKESVTKEPGANGESVCDSLKDFFDVKAAVKTYRLTFWSSKGTRRTQLALTLVICFFVIGAYYGDETNMYLFARYRFRWDEVDYSIFTTYRMLISTVGTALSVSLLSQWLKMDDAMIGFLACISKILAGIFYAFAYPAWVMYLVPVVECVYDMAYVSMRAMVSKLVPSDELGKVNSMLGICQAITPLVFGPVYSQLYVATLEYFPGAVFLLGAALTAIAAVVFLWMYHIQSKERAKTQEEPQDGISLQTADQTSGP